MRYVRACAAMGQQIATSPMRDGGGHTIDTRGSLECLAAPGTFRDTGRKYFAASPFVPESEGRGGGGDAGLVVPQTPSSLGLSQWYRIRGMWGYDSYSAQTQQKM